jgi:hypothetical protein
VGEEDSGAIERGMWIMECTFDHVLSVLTIRSAQSQLGCLAGRCCDVEYHLMFLRKSGDSSGGFGRPHASKYLGPTLSLS